MLAFEPPGFGRAVWPARSCCSPAYPGRRVSLQSFRAPPYQSGRGTRPFSRLSRRQRTRRSLQGRRQVVKNVTGYDLCKLMAGSFGTLAALEEVTVKVLPRPEASLDRDALGLDPLPAVRALSRALASPHEVSGAVFIPAPSTTGLMSLPGSTAVAALRLEGPDPSVIFRRERLLAELGSDCEATSLDDESSIPSGKRFRECPAARRGPETAPSGASRSHPAEEAGWARRSRAVSIPVWYLDWAGGLSGWRSREPRTVARR